ncbi:unnamed protein product [Chrysodeixis includens]|uniref:Uncharacterized protein n=1 Tax=Chrysodeixis includens TaxID=689277 RepID=A0A9N8L326_CHRIL|nr:unnamed protein product [Chrysodeixis includens]
MFCPDQSIATPSTKPVHSNTFSMFDPFIEQRFMVFVLLSDQYSLLPDTCTAKALTSLRSLRGNMASFSAFSILIWPMTFFRLYTRNASGTTQVFRSLLSSRPSGQLQTCPRGVLRQRCEQPALSRAQALLAAGARSRNAFTPIMLASCSTTACRSRPVFLFILSSVRFCMSVQ